MNFGFSGEMIFIFFLALILFGPKKLPEIGRQIGRIMNEFRRASNEFRSQIESEIQTLEAQKPQILPPTQAPLGSLASRILNPPTPEQLDAAEKKVGTQNESSVETKLAASPAATQNASAVETQLAASPTASPAPKVAPDA